MKTEYANPQPTDTWDAMTARIRALIASFRERDHTRTDSWREIADEVERALDGGTE